MLAARSLVKTGATLAAQQTRQMSAVGTRPLVRISFAEKLVHGAIMTVAYCTVPVWVLVNIRNYRGLGK
ncbi:cytochrome c oxidase polypeptide viii [Holotrichia oblita]|uniref:Cytochrome c oxidase polypeptide viii n=1 Tax=Holotrichia oblita TaxID=644536 RepID=A0ACB9TK90_HOLOL|nr:cytochrome c oxidase polypeptide viii [Holotrichia oblita]